MTLPNDDGAIMRLYDDELDEVEAAELERRIVDDPEAAAALRGLEQVGSLVRHAAEEQGAEADDIVVRVMACIDAEEPASPGPGARVVPLSPRWRRAVPAVAGVLALAAAAVLVFRSGPAAHHPSSDQPKVAGTQGEPHHAAKLPAAGQPDAHPKAVADTSPPVAIETVDFGSHDGAIFMVSAGQDSTPVVWLTDEPAVQGGRTQPL